VLYGDYNPSGKLPMTFPRSEGLIEYKKIEKWNGELPQTVAGNAGSLINIK
jgi:hypothetical protein